MAVFDFLKKQKKEEAKENKEAQLETKETEQVEKLGKEDLKNEKKESKSKNRPAVSKGNNFDVQFVKLIKRPILTEKAMTDQVLNKYYFEVSQKANKTEIKHIIEKNYKVKIDKINILNERQKKKRWMRTFNNPSRYKKAVVTLKEGYKIDLGI